MVFAKLGIYSVIMAVFVFGLAYAGTLSVNVTPQQGVIDAGYNTLITTSITGGTAPYTCSWSYFNLFTPSAGGNFGGSSCNVIFYGNASDLGNPEQINVNVNDNSGNSGSGSTYMGVDTRLTLNIFPTTNTVYAGNSIIFTNNTVNGSVEYSGSGDYISYKYLNVSSNVIKQGNTFLFNYPGVYRITEEVEDTNNANATATANITVLPNAVPAAPPINAILSPLTGTLDVGQSKVLNVNVTGGTGAYTYAWFVDNVIVSGETANIFSFSENVPSTYKIYSKITDSNGATANTVNSIILVNALPSITLKPITQTIDITQTASLKNTTINGTPPYTYAYEFNGNVNENGNNFTFKAPGTYNIKETATDAVGESTSANATVFVNAPKINATIAPVSSIIDVGQNAILSSKVSGGFGAYVYLWKVNGNDNATTNTLYLSPGIGTYNINLEVTDAVGDIGTSNNAVLTVNPLPTITIAASENTVYVGSNILITNNTIGGTQPYTYSYVVSNNAIRNGNNFSFMHNGMYNITETVTDSKGKSNNASVIITVLNKPVVVSASITPNNSTVHKKQEITLTANVITNAANDSYVYKWYVKTPNSSNYYIIENATLKNYTFDTFPQTTLGIYYFIINVNDITSNIIVNSTVATVNVITPASCYNPQYNTSNCDNDNQKICIGNEDNYNQSWNTWNVNSQGYWNTSDWNGQGNWNDSGTQNNDSNCGNLYNYSRYNNTKTQYNVSKDNCYNLYVNFGHDYSNYNNTYIKYQNSPNNNKQRHWFNVQDNYLQHINNNKNHNNHGISNNQGYKNNWFE